MPEPEHSLSDLMTITEAAEYLRIPRPTVYYLARTGQLPIIKIGGRYRIKRSEVDRDVLRVTDESVQPKALAVDDEPAMQALYKKFLRRVNLARVVVGSGGDALANAREHKFALIFLDLHLPDCSGDELYSQISQMQPGVPIVIVTGQPESELLAKILSSGPVTILQKPLELDRLNQTVKQLGFKGMVLR